MACEIDKHQETMVEDKLPLDRLVNIVQGTNMEAGRERQGKCLEALPLFLDSPLPLPSLLPWMIGMTSVESESAVLVRDCGGDILFYGRLEADC
jgi:hypothetical protein